MNERTLAAAWLSYDALLPATAGETQRRETRRAFYAGAQALLGIACNAIVVDEKEPTDEELQVLPRLQLELEAFAIDIERGLA